jgi:hypothetical protein
MTSIAVTASVCASASEAALLVASFMPFSLDLGMTHRRARTRRAMVSFILGTPHDNVRLRVPTQQTLACFKIEQQ